MRQGVKALGDRMMGRGPLPLMGRRAHRDHLAVLAYHGVEDRACFARHLDHLAEHHTVVSLDDVLASFNGSPLPPRAVLVTFDDGERSVLTDAAPELEARAMPSVLFAIPGLVGSSDPFWWYEAEELFRRGGASDTLVDVRDPAAAVATMKRIPDAARLATLDDLRVSAGGEPHTQPQLTPDELLELDRRGMTVENHSWSHPLLDKCSDEKIAHEVDAAADRLEQILDRPMRAFAYPNGNVDERVSAAVRRRGHDVGFLFDHRLAVWPPIDPMRVSRVRVNSTTSIDRFAAIVSGVHPWFHTLRGGS